MRTGRPIPPLSLTDPERETLRSWARRPKSAQALALRARMILLCGEGNNNTRVARQIRVRVQSVCKDATHWSTRSLASAAGLSRHFTPTSASWINPVERWFAALTENRFGVAFTAASANWRTP